MNCIVNLNDIKFGKLLFLPKFQTMENETFSKVIIDNK